MSKMIQIRNVPDAIHRKLKSRAAQAGMSLSDFLLRELRQTAELPTLEEWLEMARQMPPIPKGLSAAQIIREERDSR